MTRQTPHTPSRFDEIVERRGTDCAKWDLMEPVYGVPAEDGLAMWVADMDFRPPRVVQQALERLAAHGIYGYPAGTRAQDEAVSRWMTERHGWTPDPDHVFTTHGLVNGTGICVDAYTDPGDGVVLFTPVYHAFARVIRAAGREVVECELTLEGDSYVPDFEAWDAQMTGRERMMILCSPHNPGGRVWTRAELEGWAAFAKRHDLVLVSDEIHCDLTMPGQEHLAMTRIEGVADRLVMLTATTKTFNIAGAHIGNVIIADPELRARFASRMGALGISPSSFGLAMATAAMSAEGAAWVDELRAYLDGNRRLFDEGIAAIPGLRSMPLEATYLSWVDFEGLGMSRDEVLERVETQARIAVNHGPTFGKGGDHFLRFNLATPRARVKEAVKRLQAAFADLQ
ncbi:MalY/PatB family protein [Limimaricola pyoseonensis]|uniref:cysteine-S-conjugate beta-lyase n=1 Tax=Limimaricola pyoseonensis TaxID=521013 RepID=A0A1G7E827_9RHOB|nr:MalY/PatB family protein [Limimaricola pyoseonensis]SDE59640.1 cystathione beta-lyase [Limimaricola pyoseonensis]